MQIVPREVSDYQLYEQRPNNQNKKKVAKYFNFGELFSRYYTFVLQYLIPFGTVKLKKKHLKSSSLDISKLAGDCRTFKQTVEDANRESSK